MKWSFSVIKILRVSVIFLNTCSRLDSAFFVGFFFFFFPLISCVLLQASGQLSLQQYCLCTIVILFTYLKILKMDLTILFTYLKIILLQYFQFLTSATICFSFHFACFALGQGTIITVAVLFMYCSNTVYVFKNIKNGSYDTIYIFKNYFVTVFSVFNFSNNPFIPNGPVSLSS